MILNKIYVNSVWGSEKEVYKIDGKKAIQAFNDLVREEMKQVYEPIGKEDFSDEVSSFKEWNSEYELVFRKCPLIVYKKDNKLIARIYSWGEPSYEEREQDIESKEVILEQIEVTE
jgi:hypothetical protein